MDNQRFLDIFHKIHSQNKQQAGIGRLNEKSLHATIKHFIEPNTDNHEIPIETFIADICNKKGIIEVQSAAFDKLRGKLDCFLKQHKVTIIHPIPANKWLVWIDEDTGELSNKRKSPKKGSEYQIFLELYKIKHLLNNENLSIHIFLIDMIEYRLLNGWSKDKKKGSTRYEYVPVQLRNIVKLDSVKDYQKLVPESLPNEFTVKQYKTLCKINQRQAGTALNILNSLDIVQRTGKDGRAYVYKRSF